MGKVGSEVEVGLKSPSVEGLKFVKELRRHSSGDVGKPRCVDRVGSKQDTEKYRGFAICIRSKREADVADFAGIKQLGRLRHGFSKLRLVHQSGGDEHKAIIARPGRAGPGIHPGVYGPYLTTPVIGLLAVAYSFFPIRPARYASRPASTASFIAIAIETASSASAIAVFSSNPS